MKAQMKKLIDVNDLIERLNASDIPYSGKINNIIVCMPKFTMYNIKADDYPENENDNFRFEIVPCDDSCDCENEPTEEVPAYVSRMIAEYHKLKDKYTKLHRMLVKHEAGTLDFKPTCPIELLEHQANVMGEYLHILEVRAEIENVKL
nr:MAG TPA: hypothetical protein [Caudoviricetes sp.]